MKKFLSFWVSISFLKQLVILGVVFVILIQGVSWSLKSYTQYGDTYVVPDLSGLSFEEASEALTHVQLIGIANDTLSFNPEIIPYGVIKQLPIAGKNVKSGRKVYLSLNDAEFARRALPDAIQMTRRNAISQLRSFGFTVSDSVVYIDAIGLDMVYGIKVGDSTVNVGSQISIRDTLQLVLGNGKDSIQ
jgi:beta-lactam-binding protein with PASTA domain